MISKLNASEVAWKAKDLRKLPLVERDAILEAAAIEAEPEYRGNRELTDFEAFDEADLHGQSSSTQAG